jgi:hypothetical protein
VTNKTKKLGSHTTKRELFEAHKAKQEIKQAMRAHRDKEFLEKPKPWIPANLSKYHPEYGDTPSEHEQRKNRS